MILTFSAGGYREDPSVVSLSRHSSTGIPREPRNNCSAFVVHCIGDRGWSRVGDMAGGGHGAHNITHGGLSLHATKGWHARVGQGMCAIMW
jgi:hypothetical protein